MTSQIRRSALALLVLAPAALFGAGCGGHGGNSELQHRLLSVADLPSGWSAAHASAHAVEATNTPCLSSLPKSPKGWSYEVASFVQGSSIPTIGEVIATGAQVGPAWKRLAAALGRCRSATLLLGGKNVEATVRPLRFPRLGGGSSAYAWSFNLAGIRLGSDLVLFQSGPYRGYISYADLGAPQTTTVAAFARAALAKAAKGSTAPVPSTISIASAPVRTAQTKMGKIAYRTVGRGPPLLLIMGYGGAMETWDRRLVNALARRHRVIVFDNAGIGATQPLPSPLTIDAMSDQTRALIGALRLGRADVLGWSMGSMIAQALAVRHPAQVRRLVLAASFPGDGSAVPPSRAELNAFESGVPQKAMAALFPADQTAAQNTYLAAVSSYPPPPSAPKDVLRAQGRGVDGWWAGTDLAGGRAAAIRVPTLVADGTVDRLDPVVNSRALARLIPRAKLELYPDAGHAFLFQDESSFVPVVEKFLR